MSIDRRELAVVAALALSAIGAGACETKSDATASSAPGDKTDAPKRSHSGAAVVAIDSSMLASIKVAVIAEQELPRTLAVGGKVQFDEDRLAHIVVPIPGQVVGLRVKVGDVVRKGQALCAISSREAALAAGERIESRRDLELAEKTAAMTQDLFDHEAASKIALQQAQNDLAKARARVARSDEALRVLGLGEVDLDNFNGRVPILAPIAGTVVERKVTEGQFVQADSSHIVSVGDLSIVWVLGDVFERDLHLVDVGQRATITTTAYPGERFTGRVNYISDSIDPATRTAKVRVSVPNPRGRLKPEMFASITLGVSEHERVVTVPSRAVFTEDGRPYIYVEVGIGRFVRRSVELGLEEGADRRVLSGLHAGDKVVVDGALLLRLEEDKRAG